MRREKYPLGRGIKRAAPGGRLYAVLNLPNGPQSAARAAAMRERNPVKAAALDENAARAHRAGFTSETPVRQNKKQSQCSVKHTFALLSCSCAVQRRNVYKRRR